MKKTVCILLSVLMLISILATAVFAGNGPSEAWMPGDEEERYYFAYATFIEYADSGMPVFDEHGMFTYKQVFSNNEVLNEASGAVYDRATNTLTLTNFNQPNYELETNMMGDDFRIKVVGDCALGAIVAFGDGWGSSITLTGDGTLTVNQKEIFGCAVRFYPEGAATACLTVGPEVSIHLYSKETAVWANSVDENEEILVLSRDATEPVTFKAEQRMEDRWYTIDVIDASEGPEEANILHYNYKDDDGDGIWCGTPTKWYNQDEELIKEGYSVYHLVWNESLGAWIADIETPRALGYEWGYLDLSTEEFNDMGFTVAKNDEGRDDWSEIRMYRDFATNHAVMTDGVNKYVSVWTWDPEKEESFQHYYTFKPVPGTENLMITDQLADVKEEDLVVDMLKVPVEGDFTRYTENREIHVGKDAPVTPTAKFKDVPAGEYYADAVAWAVRNNITTGTSTTTFSPNEGCTRGQVVTFLWRSQGQPKPSGTGNPFKDVKPGDYYYDAVLWAVEKGITKGTSATTFSPDDVCTRGQIVTFLYRWKGEPKLVGASNPFKDVKSGDYFYSPVLWAVVNGVTKGTTDTTFSPDDTCTRAQVVTFMYRGR